MAIKPKSHGTLGSSVYVPSFEQHLKLGMYDPPYSINDYMGRMAHRLPVLMRLKIKIATGYVDPSVPCIDRTIQYNHLIITHAFSFARKLH